MRSARTTGPALLRWAARGLTILGVAAVIAAALYAWIGPPTQSRVYRQNEIARFAPTASHGLGQLAGETLLLGLVAYAARRWLGVRL